MSIAVGPSNAPAASVTPANEGATAVGPSSSAAGTTQPQFSTALQNAQAEQQGTSSIVSNLKQVDTAQPQTLGQYQAKQSTEALGGDFVALTNAGAGVQTSGTLAKDFNGIAHATSSSGALAAIKQTAADLTKIAPPASNLSATGALSQSKSDLGYLAQAVQNESSASGAAPKDNTISPQVTKLLQQVTNGTSGGLNSAGRSNELVQLGNLKSIAANDGGNELPSAVGAAVQKLVSAAGTQANNGVVSQQGAGVTQNYQSTDIGNLNTATSNLVSSLSTNVGGLNGSQGSLQSFVAALNTQTKAAASE